MRWSPRQRAMLAAMGLRPWAVPEAGRPEREASAMLRDGKTARNAGEAPRRPAADPAADAPTGATNAADARAGRRAEPSPDHAAQHTRPHEVGQLDWTALRDSVASCRACGLCEGRTQTVFGVGNTQAHWMIVGEAPGEREDLLGEPFVGKSGQLLDAMLRSIGLTRQPAPASRQVYIANTLKCRPPGNRNPRPDELARCEPYLVRQIELVEPRVIVAMGRFAVQSLLRSTEPIGRLRGRVHRYHEVPLVVTYHPAYLLRNPLDKARAWDDLCLALETSRTRGAV